MRYDDLREEYTGGEPLSEATADKDPFLMLERWLDEATSARLPIANGMVLATAGDDGRPSARVVLLKEIEGGGLVFYTNYRSPKGRQLDVNPHAAGVLWWVPMHRQVRVEGTVERLSPDESDAYFRVRPRDSNLSAMASAQSEVVPNRAVLEDQVAKARARWDGKQLVRPEHWGGFRLVPTMFEFFQGQPDRLHDRLRYSRREGSSWIIERLSP